jgi:hypothetical protein
LQPPNRKPEKEAVVFIRGFFRKSVFFFFSLLLFLIFETAFSVGSTHRKHGCILREIPGAVTLENRRGDAERESRGNAKP